MKPATVIIKKYGNRRLYDTAGSRYVNLDDIARLVREGKPVQVVDAKTGNDLTRVTLTQLIMQPRWKRAFLSCISSTASAPHTKFPRLKS